MKMKMILGFITLMVMSVFFEAGALSFEEFFVTSMFESAKKDVREVFNPPTNTNDSIQYSLFTRTNPDTPCFMEPTPEEFDHCPFDPDDDTKILIHGFLVNVTTFPSFVLIKDELLKYGSYNVIYVDWSRHNGHPFAHALLNIIPVAKKIVEFIKFVKKHTGARFRSFHLIGHSLGSLISGSVGKNLCKSTCLGRITGLDPGSLGYDVINPEVHLHYTDAKQVDVIHSSDVLSGQGLANIEPMGDLDFYPNGGHVQMEACNEAKIAEESGWNPVTTLESPYYTIVCNHVMSINYMMHSINDCEYESTQCDDFESLPTCKAKGKSTARMGLFAERIEGLPPKSKFYLKASGNPPYC